MTEQEKIDLEVMKQAVINRKVRAFDYLRDVNRYNETDMKHSGYGRLTVPEAMQKVFQDALKDVEKLHRDYIRKYPD